MSDNSYIVTAPQTQIMSEHFYEAEDMSDILTLAEGYGISKIKLAKNVYLSSSIEFAGDAVIDLNRKTLEYIAINPLKVQENSSLTFKNGSVSFKNSVGVSLQGENAELSFEKVTVSATSTVAETLETNASINLTNSTVQTVQNGYGSSRSASAGSLFVIKGENANISVSGSKFETTKSIVSASENATAFKIIVKESKINTTAPILDINTDEVVPTLDIDESTMQTSTVTELNTSPITSGSFNVDPTELGATLEGVEQFDVNGSMVLAEDFASLVDMVEAGSTINISNDIDFEKAVVIDKKLSINLGNYRLSALEDTAGDGVFHVIAGGELVINADEGGIYGKCKSIYNMALWADGGKIVINGGYYSNEDAGEDNQYDLIYASNGGEIIINDGSFMCHTPKWTLNLKDNTNSSIVVNGGLFFNYNPAESHTENPVANFVGEDRVVVERDGVYTVEKTTLTELFADETVDSITLADNVDLAETAILNHKLTLNLNGFDITRKNDTNNQTLRANAGGDLTINGNGIINGVGNSNYAIALRAHDGGKITINGGTYTNIGAGNDDAYDLIYASKNGVIIINNGTFMGQTPAWLLNLQDNSGASILVNGGTFVGYNPAKSHTENPVANFVAENHFVYKVGNNYSVASLDNLVNIINNNAGAEIILLEAYVVNTTLTINLNGCTIINPYDKLGDGVFHVVTGGNLTINGEGTIDGVSDNDYNMAIWVEGGKVTINGGTYTNVGATDSKNPAVPQFDLLYVKGGELVINGGTFIAETPKWTLNLRDDIAGIISVSGGTFVNYNPAESHTENPVANFVAEGYKSVADGENFVVVAE